MPIVLTCGRRQTFRRRTDDVTLRGQIDGLVSPLRRAEYRLNDADRQPFYVEAVSDEGIDWVNGYKVSPGELRCKEVGDFCIEIPVESAALVAGENHLRLSIEDATGRQQHEALTFIWDPRPVTLPLDLRDLSGFDHVQQIGQVMNGAFDLDRACNLIRSRGPVAPDACLILGSQHASQEATFAVRFPDLGGAKWLGVSDYFVRQEEGVPPRGVKVGWSSAGMATLSPRQEARSFVAWGDHSSRPEEWAVATNPPASIAIEPRVRYRVRHRITFANGIDRVRFRVWPAAEAEPDTWLCDEHDGAVPAHLPRHRRASFSLFQHMGMPIEWSDILVRAIEPGPADEVAPSSGRAPFLGRERPGAF